MFDEGEHAWQRVFDGARAIFVNFTAETDRIGHIAPNRCARLFKFAKQKGFFRALGKEHLDGLEMRAGHGKDVRGAID